MTDRGIPTLAFDLFVNAQSVQTINLRDVFAGKLPETPHPVLTEPFPYPFCSSPIHVPEISPEALRAKHSGQPDPDDGLCYSTDHGPEGLAVGYVTVDLVRRCSNALPSDPEYFEGSEQVAGTRNVLWGDQFFVDAGQDFAQGLEAVAIPADVGTAEPAKTFYRSFASGGEDARAMLPTTHLARAATEGTFDGDTDLLIWIEQTRTTEPVACDAPAFDECPVTLDASFVAERGSDAVEHFTVDSPPISARWSVGDPELPVTAPFTVAELRAHDPTEFCILSAPPPGFSPQMSVGTVMKAFGRFSVGFRGVGLPE